MAETALILPVLDAEPLVQRFRERYDPSAADGVPAHVTLLYPFLDSAVVGTDDFAALTTVFASTQPFDVVFARCARFEPKTLFLAPEPEEPIRVLMRRIFARWPECPPYAGTIAAEDVVPHLTVCDSVTGDHLDRVELALAGGLPIRTRLAEAWLIERAAERWTTRHRFVLG